MAIKFDRLFELMRSRGVTVYRLRKDKVIGMATIEKMKSGKGHVDTVSIERLCEYLDCQPGDIMDYEKSNIEACDTKSSKTNQN